MNFELPSAAWKGLRVLITANDHRYYNQVVTITGRSALGDGTDRALLVGELSTGEVATFREGEYKVVKQQD